MLHTNKQTNKQINAGKNIYLLAEVKNNNNNDDDDDDDNDDDDDDDNENNNIILITITMIFVRMTTGITRDTWRAQTSAKVYNTCTIFVNQH